MVGSGYGQRWETVGVQSEKPQRAIHDTYTALLLLDRAYTAD